MAIHKTPNYLKRTTQPYITILKQTVESIKDPIAYAIFTYLSGKPHDWIIQEKELMNRFNLGRDSVRKRLKILRELGLLIKIAGRDDKGRITHWETQLLDQIPKTQSSGENKDTQITENPASGKTRHLENQTHTNNRSNESNNIYNIGTSDEVPNMSYSKFDGEEENEAKSDYKAKQINHEVDDKQVIETTSKSGKSDYFENQPNNQSVSKSKIQYSIKNILEENIFQIPEQVIQDWITNRKKKRTPVTKTAWNKINKELAKCKEQGIDPIEAFETMVASGWQSLKLEYFESHNTDKKPKINNMDTSWGAEVFKPFHEIDMEGLQ